MEIWPIKVDHGLRPTKKEKVVLETFSKKTFHRYWEMIMGDERDQLQGIVKMEVSERVGDRRVALYENYEEGELVTLPDGFLMRWRGSENNWRFNTDRPLIINRRSRVGMVTDLKSGREGLVVENDIKDGGKRKTIRYTFTR